jgi:hypothetical protein
VFCSHQMLPVSLNTDHENIYKCVQNVILTDVYFSYSCSLNHSYIYRQLMRQWLVLSITRKERNKQHTTGKQYSCYTDLQNKHNGIVCVLILTTPLAPFLTGHLWGYFTSNAMTTFDRPSIPGILEVCSGVSLYKI